LKLKEEQTEEPEDEDSLFSKSLVPRLKWTPYQGRAFVRLQIQQLLYQTEFTVMDTTDYHTPMAW